MNFKEIILASHLICLSINTWADVVPNITAQESRQPTIEVDRSVPVENIYKPAIPTINQFEQKQDQLKQSKENQDNVVTEEDLLNDPVLLAKLLDVSIINKHKKAIALLLPIYAQINEKDEVLYLYAQATLAKMNDDLTGAIKLYRQIIASHPQLNPVRLDLADTLVRNKEFEAARGQFEKLRSAEDLPDDVSLYIDQYLVELDKQNDWQFDANIRFLNESNINNAPKQQQLQWGTGTLNLPKKEKGQGLGYYFAASKDWSIHDGFVLKNHFSTLGKWYWNNHKYDDISLTASVGIGYKNAKQEINILPTVSKRWFSGDPYSFDKGMRLEYNHWLSSQLQLLSAYEFTHKSFNKRKFLAGNSHIVSNTLFYISNPLQYWIAGIDYINDGAEDKSDAYQRGNLRVGWGQEWKNGLSTNLNISFGRRHYQGPDLFNITRKNNEFSSSLSLWHRAVHFKGITPRLVINWQKTTGNHFMYNYQKADAYISFQKRF